MFLIRLLQSIGIDPKDTPEVVLQKNFLVYLGSAMSLGGLLWGTLSLLYGLIIPSLIPYGYTVATIINFFLFYHLRRFGLARFVQVFLSLLLPFLFQFALGSFASTGAVMLWALIALVGAFTFEELRHTLYWILLYIALTIALGLIDANASTALSVPTPIKTVFFVVNIAVISTIVSGLSYYFLKNRGKILEELAEAKRETDLLLATVDEGLFIISRRNGIYEIGSEQSAAVSGIFETDRLPAMSLLAALSPYLTPGKSRELENYLTLLNAPSVKKAMIRDLNPLELVHTTVGNPGKEKYLQFGFWPVTAGSQEQYLVRVKDVTKATLLQQQLTANEKKSEENTKMILSVLHIGPNLLSDFLTGVREELSVITRILQTDRSVEEALQNMEQLQRSAHSIKGNASLLDLKILASAAHEFEENLARIRANEKAEWNDFIPLALQVSGIENILGGLEDLLTRLQSFRAESSGQAESAIAAIPQNIGQMVERSAKEYGKKIETDFSGYDSRGVPDRYAYLLRDIGVQLARNSIVHGIELPAERESSGKGPVGKLSVSLRRDGDQCLFTLRDDGKSFDFEAIRRHAVKEGVADAENVGTWDQKKLIRVMFSPGFSTASSIDMTAGRGMGLDIVRQRVKNAGGDLRVNFQPGQYTEFSIRLPVDG